ncbi:MAG: hypothetical protein LBU06_07950, partial [Desulfovibrio sp.]|nr:hypothetical protein [Desulfovibrio sp.]
DFCFPARKASFDKGEYIQHIRPVGERSLTPPGETVYRGSQWAVPVWYRVPLGAFHARECRLRAKLVRLAAVSRQGLANKSLQGVHPALSHDLCTPPQSGATEICHAAIVEKTD